MILHSAVDSPVFRLIETYLFDIVIFDDGYSLRLELFQDMNDCCQFRCLFWQTETVEVGVSISDGECIKRDEATHHVLVDWAAYLSNDYSCFASPTKEEAMQVVLEDIRKYLMHVSNSDL